MKIQPYSDNGHWSELCDAMHDALTAYQVDLKRSVKRSRSALYMPDLDYQKRSTAYSRTGCIFQDGTRSAAGTRVDVPSDWKPQQGRRVSGLLPGMAAPPGGQPTMTDCRGRSFSLTHYANGTPIQWRSFPTDETAPIEIIRTAQEVRIRRQQHDRWHAIRRAVRQAVQDALSDNAQSNFAVSELSIPSARAYVAELATALETLEAQRLAEVSGKHNRRVIERIDSAIHHTQKNLTRRRVYLDALRKAWLEQQEADHAPDTAAGDDTPAVQQDAAQVAAQTTTQHMAELAEAIA